MMHKHHGSVMSGTKSAQPAFACLPVCSPFDAQAEPGLVPVAGPIWEVWDGLHDEWSLLPALMRPLQCTDPLSHQALMIGQDPSLPATMAC